MTAPFRLMVALGVLAWVLAGLYLWINEPYWRLQNRLDALKTEAEIRQTFGAPARIAKAGEAVGYIPGYSHADRPVTGKLLIYPPASGPIDPPDVVLYVYIDREGRVEQSVIGRR